MNLIEILVICISKPLLIGIYKNKNLIKNYSFEGRTSDILPKLFKNILKNYEIENIIYVNTPGSFLSIKISYIFLKTICITKNINLLAINGFEFNNNSPIKALGKKYFIQDKNGTRIDFLENDCEIKEFKLPLSIDKYNFNKETLPVYNLPAV